MAAGNAEVPGGEPGELELSSRLNPSGGCHPQDLEAGAGVPGLSSSHNLSGGSHRGGPGAQSSVPESISQAAIPNGGTVHGQNPRSVVVNFAQQEILNVLWIEDSPEHKAALKEWDRKEQYLSSKVDRKEKRKADLTNQIFNIVGFFSVFQGVVLTAVSQLKSDTQNQCDMVWVPALLSSVAAFVAIVGVGIKFSTLQELETSIFNEKIAQRAVAARATKLRATGRQFSFIEHAGEGRKIKDSSRISISISTICVILSLFFFTGLFILSYVMILCKGRFASGTN